MSNHLTNQTSPYLLQHARQPVDWYPWCDEAFAKAKAEDKPVFLSIGYSTCHWCHVMAHESFDDAEVARLLNRHFVAIKVDKEERPDIDSIYMTVCQAFTGSGGWPMSIFMTPEQKPFFAGTYFPKTARYGTVGFLDLLQTVQERWAGDRAGLLSSAEGIVSLLQRQQTPQGTADTKLIDDAVELYKQSYDEAYAGFGFAPKFPAAHNLLFLLTQFEKSGDKEALKMAEMTLLQLYCGGIFDHIGYGFSRYSTDRFYLVPHFEKMLYDNALLILAYCKAYSLTSKTFYRDVAEKTATYILREMTDPSGGFYSAQDADSDGVEGKYYVFTPKELIELLGEEIGRAFNQYYDITEEGNFEGKSIPNLLHTKEINDPFASCLPQVYAYRKDRTKLHLDDKILTAWNGLMIAALCRLYQVSKQEAYLIAAKKAQRFLERELWQSETLYVSFRGGKRGSKGFLDDYACEIFALLSLYEVTLERQYLERARACCQRVIRDYYDNDQGGFWLYGADNEPLISRPKETYDGAVPSGNSMMAYNLVRLSLLCEDENMQELAQRQLTFLSGAAKEYPTGFSMFLTALSDFLEPPEKTTVVLAQPGLPPDLPGSLPPYALVTVLETPTEEFPLLDGRTTFYICRGHSCLPPVNELTS